MQILDLQRQSTGEYTLIHSENGEILKATNLGLCFIGSCADDPGIGSDSRVYTVHFKVIPFDPPGY